MTRRLKTSSAFVLIVILFASGCNAYGSAFSRYNLVGTIKAEPKSKVIGGGENSITAKFSLRLDIPGQGERIVNCDSTQCASLAIGDEVVLSCFSEWHFTVPSEEECRFTRINPKPM